MQTQRFDFENSRGQKLSGRLVLPDGTPRAFALFAHCFTCDKTTKAAVRISQALAGLGVGVLRFDFTGLGESEGELTGFSANVQDLIDAAAAMARQGSAPALLVGHSLGGAAALAAAGEIASVKAVATIGAPGDPAHALRLLGDGLATIEATGQAQVNIGGRPFMISRAFVEDARMQDLPGRITRLGRALLVLHSPVDAIVGIENASEIFLAARHPKSFVSLDTASHLLSDNRDADYAASVIAVWAGRYLGAAAERSAEAPPGVALVEETGAGKFQVQVSVGGTHFFADEPQDVGGLGSGPTPHELVSAGLGACTAMTLRMYADRKGWPLKRTRVAVSHERVAGQTPANVFTRRIAVEGPLDATQTARLFEIAARCPVHRALEEGSRVVTGPFVAADAPAPASDAEEHFREMEDACRTADAAGSP